MRIYQSVPAVAITPLLLAAATARNGHRDELEAHSPLGQPVTERACFP